MSNNVWTWTVEAIKQNAKTNPWTQIVQDLKKFSKQ